MFNYNLINTPSFIINKKIINNIFKNIKKKININQKWTLNLIFLDDNSIRKLNNKYRKKNNTTDVLSFHYYNDFKNLNTNNIAWEIVFSENKIITQWKEYNLWSEKEFYKLLIHSILHILGFDHENEKDYKKMQKYENIIWIEIFEKK